MAKKNSKKNKNKIVPIKKKECVSCGRKVTGMTSDKCIDCRSWWDSKKESRRTA